jgi:hypothetical protein
MKHNVITAGNRQATHAHAPARSSAVADRDGMATGECSHGPTRELAQRVTGTVEVRLLWRPKIERVELAVRDLATGAGFHITVAPGDAIDAFYHPYVHAAKRDTSLRQVRHVGAD